jgi:hypothetical protein
MLTLRLRLIPGLGALSRSLLLQLDLARFGILLRELVSRRVHEIDTRARRCYTERIFISIIKLPGAGNKTNPDRSPWSFDEAIMYTKNEKKRVQNV